MRKSEELHALIHSLSKSEKRYFRLFCTREASGENYLKLFGAMERQEDHDEQAIKKQFRGEKFVKQLHVTKNYLRKLILKSLRNFHAGLSRDAELKDLLRNVEILYHKELFQHALTELKRAEKLAGNYELLTGMVEVEGWKRKLEQAMRPHNYPAFRDAVLSQGDAITLLQNNNDYWRLAVDYSIHFFKRGPRPVKNIHLLEDPENACAVDSRVLHYNILYLRNINEGRTEEAGEALIALIDFLETRPERLESEPGTYVSSVNNLLSYFVFQKKHREALEMIQKAKKIYENWSVTSENRTLLKQILRTYNIELEIYRDTRAFEKHKAFIDRTERFVKAYTYKMPKEYLLSFWFQLASIHFMRKDAGRSLHWINQILNTRFKDIRTDLQVQARMLNLMLHLEQQNLFVLRYFVDSTRRYLKKVKQVQPFEEVLLRFFIKIGKIPFEEYRDAFAELKEKLFPEEGEPMVPSEVLGYIDYRAWIAEKTGVSHPQDPKYP